MKKPNPNPALTGFSYFLLSLALVTLALFVYLSGAVAARLMWERGQLTEGSLAYKSAVVIYRPLNVFAVAHPSFRSAFDAWVSLWR